MIINQNKDNNQINAKDIIKSAKKVTKTFTLRRQLSKLLLLNFLTKFLTERKYI